MAIKKKRRVSIVIDMTPMVDIAFLLLIFYMVSTVFSEPQAMEINLPPDTEIPVKESKVLTVRVDEYNNMYWNMSKEDPEPIPFDDDLDKPIPFDDDEHTGNASVSHAPLNLGGGSSAPTPVAPKPVEKVVSGDRITGMKTFFTKLHAGSLDFLEEQINNWLKNNPAVTVKRTNTTTGMVVAKKTEPNLIITIWY